MHLITLFRVMNPHQRCLHANVKYRNEPKQAMPKSKDLSRSLEIKSIWTFDTESPNIFNKIYINPTVVQPKGFDVREPPSGPRYPRCQVSRLELARTNPRLMLLVFEFTSSLVRRVCLCPTAPSCVPQTQV